jgi:hypothetical protein
LVTEANPALTDDWDNGFLFLSRLPMTYNECRQAITRAVEAEDWGESGVTSEEPATKNRKPATHPAQETMATLYRTNYRAVVVHSDDHDERRQKRVSEHIEQDRELLTIYKDQHVAEQNFGFLKDPVFVNSLFPKSPRRIEAVGLVLVLALLIWRLMELTMRLNLAAKQEKITAWEKRLTSRPTSFMMTAKFIGIFVLTSHLGRRLANPLTLVQLQYLDILELTPDIFTKPPGKRKPEEKQHRRIAQNSC